MYEIVRYERNFIEITITGVITRDEFQDILNEIKEYCNHVRDGGIIFDTSTMRDTLILKIFLEDFGFYRKFKNCVNRLAFLSQGEKERFMIQEFGPNPDMEIRTFSERDYKKAYDWVAKGASEISATETAR